MLPLLTRIRRRLEKMFGVWAEGPEPPERLGQMVTYFANGRPRATRAEWQRFATEHANNAYRAGYLRGYEYTERDPDERDALSRANPDEVADALFPGWRWTSEPIVLEEPDEEPLNRDRTEAEEVEELVRLANEERR